LIVTENAAMDSRSENLDLDDEMSGSELSLGGIEDDAHKDRYMTFLIGDQNYGIDIMHVTEIVGLQDIAEVPDVPSYVKGMINLRGNVIPVIDVRDRFGMTERDYDARTCVVVVTVGGSTVGLIVDRVNEVAVFPEEQISQPPQRGETSQGSEYICGLGKQGEQVTILLETNRLIYGNKVPA
jgi:purine-binding chemotaxis protein CheW